MPAPLPSTALLCPPKIAKLLSDPLALVFLRGRGPRLARLNLWTVIQPVLELRGIAPVWKVPTMEPDF
jgi:hypothetical protein